MWNLSKILTYQKYSKELPSLHSNSIKGINVLYESGSHLICLAGMWNRNTKRQLTSWRIFTSLGGKPSFQGIHPPWVTRVKCQLLEYAFAQNDIFKTIGCWLTLKFHALNHKLCLYLVPSTSHVRLLQILTANNNRPRGDNRCVDFSPNAHTNKLSWGDTDTFCNASLLVSSAWTNPRSQMDQTILRTRF